MYGVANLMGHIRSDVDLAKHFEALVESDERFEVIVPRKFALVCFRLKDEKEGKGRGDLNVTLLDMINSSGRSFMVHSMLGKKFVIRCAIGGSLTKKSHINGLWKLIQEKTDDLLCCKS